MTDKTQAEALLLAINLKDPRIIFTLADRTIVAAELCRLLDRIAELEALQAAAPPAPASVPVLYVSPEQFAHHRDPEGDDSAKAGRYLPARKTPAGKFTQPLYAHAPAPAAVAVLESFFSFCDDDGFTKHDSLEAAKAASQDAIDMLREEAGTDEWPGSVGSVCYGLIVGQSTEVPGEQGPGGEETADYVLLAAAPAQAWPSECDSPELCRVHRGCAGQYGTKNTCPSFALLNPCNSAAPAQAVAVTDDMALAFHRAISDGAIGQDDVDDIKAGLRAVLCDAAAPAQEHATQLAGQGLEPTDRQRVDAFTHFMLANCTNAELHAHETCSIRDMVGILGEWRSGAHDDYLGGQHGRELREVGGRKQGEGASLVCSGGAAGDAGDRDSLVAAPAQAQEDARDTERLDWLTFNLSGSALRAIGVVWSEHADARRAIDAARAAQG